MRVCAWVDRLIAHNDMMHISDWCHSHLACLCAYLSYCVSLVKEETVHPLWRSCFSPLITSPCFSQAIFGSTSGSAGRHGLLHSASRMRNLEKLLGECFLTETSWYNCLMIICIISNSHTHTHRHWGTAHRWSFRSKDMETIHLLMFKSRRVL